MIRAKEKANLTVDEIMSRVTEYDIYRYYLGRDFQTGQAYNSPFREDKNPSFLIGNRGGFLHHIDLAKKELSGNCIQFVQQLYGLDFNGALRKIDADMGLGITSGHISTYKRTVATSRTVKDPKDTLIQVKSKKFDPTELAYWNQFHIDLKDLQEEDVYSVKELYINRIKMPIKATDLCFGYLYGEKWKIYWPLKTKPDKWKTNVPLTHMDGLENLCNCSIGLILKSKKDKIVAKKFLTPCVAAVQNESSGCISEENIKYLQDNVEDLYVIFDNDKAGVEACMYYNQFGFGYWNVPQSYRHDNIKDIAELVQKYGPDILREEVSKKIKL